MSPDPHPRIAAEARAMLRRVLLDWPDLDPETVAGERAAFRAWIEEPGNRPSGAAYIAALTRRFQDDA